MTQYYVDMSTDLRKELQAGEIAFPEGLSLVERWGPVRAWDETWLLNDETAPEELEGRKVALEFQLTEDGPTVITNRTALNY